MLSMEKLQKGKGVIIESLHRAWISIKAEKRESLAEKVGLQASQRIRIHGNGWKQLGYEGFMAVKHYSVI